MLYKDAVEDLIGHLQKQIQTTNSDLKRTKRFHLPLIVSKNNECEKKINKTIEEKPIQTIKTQKLTNTSRSPVLNKRKHFIEKRDLNLLDECQVYVWKLPKGNLQSTRQQRIYSTLK